MKNKTEYKELLNEICQEDCSPDKYCILKQILISAHLSERLLVQLKCIEKFKYEKSQEKGSDIGWDKACELWVELGHAKKFNDIYDANKSFKAIYKEVKNANKQ